MFTFTPITLANTLADKLGWVKEKNPQGICSGHYIVSPISTDDRLQNGRDVKINGDHMTINANGQTTLYGHVHLLKQDLEAFSDRAILNRDPVTHKPSTLDLNGNVMVKQAGKVWWGNKAHLDLQTKTGNGDKILYRLHLPQITHHPHESVGSEYAWGTAAATSKTDKATFNIKKATYSTCPPTHRPAWQLKAANIHLNRDTGRGSAKHATLYFKGIPFLYVPYLTFPIDNRRQSGFLTPSFGYHSDGGFEMTLPYYFNLAPNLDATLTLHPYSRRGLMTEGELRWLSKRGYGLAFGTFLPNDQAFEKFQQTEAAKNSSKRRVNRLLAASNNRSALHFENIWVASPHVEVQSNINWVSDDYYFQDFGTDLEAATENQLIQQGTLAIRYPFWQSILRVEHVQTLHPINQTPIDETYSRLPQWILSAEHPLPLIPAIHFSWHSEVTHFLIAENPDTGLQRPNAWRFSAAPTLSLPLTKPYGFLIPKLTFNAAYYDLNRGVTGYPDTLSRTVPTFSIDTGLYFDGPFTFRGGHYIQTLEPRLFYVYTPFRDQRQIPIFDTGYAIFTTDQLFSPNRFTGNDRIGDTHQLSMGLTTRFLTADQRREFASFTIGEILYFKDRKVRLCTGATPGCTPDEDLVGFTPLDTRFSPLLTKFSIFWTPHLSTNLQSAFDSSLHSMNNMQAGLHYTRDPGQVFNIFYRYLRNGEEDSNLPGSPNLSQVGFSTAWPLTKRWQTILGWRYNVSHDHPQSFLAGFSYQSCCWAFRIVASREFNHLESAEKPAFHNKIYLQIALKGLGIWNSSDPAALLENSVTGYRDRFKRRTK